MSTYTQIYYHITFSTKHRDPVFVKERRDDLYRYIWGILKNKQCHLYRVNGVEDHIHLLTALHPKVNLADLVRELKTSTSSWIKGEAVFPEFTHWQDGYGAFTKSHADKDKAIEYIKGQEEHHKHVSFLEEIRQFLEEEGIDYDPRYLK